MDVQHVTEEGTDIVVGLGVDDDEWVQSIATHNRARVGSPVQKVLVCLEGGIALPGVGDLALVAGGEAGARENVSHKCHALHLVDVPLVQPLPSEGCRPVKRLLKFCQLGEERKKAACVLEQEYTHTAYRT